jgi:hypothetical protein
MDEPETLSYTTYQARSQWYIEHWGPPGGVHEAMMEDGVTKVGVMVFPPRQTDSPEETREIWTYATNGMSERRMPCRKQPHGDPSHRLELVAYTREEAPWVAELLLELARYPFEHESGLAIGQTLPVKAGNEALWFGYLLTNPLVEVEEFNPLPIRTRVEPDWIFHAQVFGLGREDLAAAMELGGRAFEEQFFGGLTVEMCVLDVRRGSLVKGGR